MKIHSNLKHLADPEHQNVRLRILPGQRQSYENERKKIMPPEMLITVQNTISYSMARNNYIQ